MLQGREEVLLARRLERIRGRLRRSILATQSNLRAAVAQLREVDSGRARADHLLELPQADAKNKPRLLERLKVNLRTLEHLLPLNCRDFAQALRKGGGKSAGGVAAAGRAVCTPSACWKNSRCGPTTCSASTSCGSYRRSWGRAVGQ